MQDEKNESIRSMWRVLAERPSWEAFSKAETALAKFGGFSGSMDEDEKAEWFTDIIVSILSRILASLEKPNSAKVHIAIAQRWIRMLTSAPYSEVVWTQFSEPKIGFTNFGPIITALGAWSKEMDIRSAQANWTEKGSLRKSARIAITRAYDAAAQTIEERGSYYAGLAIVRLFEAMSWRSKKRKRKDIVYELRALMAALFMSNQAYEAAFFVRLVKAHPNRRDSGEIGDLDKLYQAALNLPHLNL